MIDLIFSKNTSVEELFYQLFALAVVLLVCFPLRAFAQGAVAKFLGDDTAEREGRLTLNPFVHLDLMGSIAIALFGFGWTKPVPINPYLYRKTSMKTGTALTALAGPAANILMAFIFMVILKITVILEILSVPLISVFIVIIQTNMFLAVFHLLPIPPLDGSRILSAILSDRLYHKYLSYERYLAMGFLIIILTDRIGITNILSPIIGGISGFLMKFIDLATFFLGRIY